MRIEIATEHSSNLVLQLKVDDNIIQVPITTDSKIEIAILDKDCPSHQKLVCPRRFKLDELRETYAKELQILADRGYSRPGMCLKLLSRLDGDVDKVCSVIEERRKRFGKLRCEKRAGGANPTEKASDEDSVPKTVTDSSERCRKSAWLEKIAKLKETYATQLELLSQKGFDNTRVNLRLLNRCDGDLNRVLEELLSKKDFNRGRWCGLKAPELESEYATQLAFLNHHGFNKLGRNLMVLKKHGGNQEAALKWLQGGHSPKWKRLKEEYASELKELTNRGFQDPRLRLMSLKKCRGDVDLATVWLKAHQQKSDC